MHSDADLAPQLTPAMIFYQTRAVKIHRFLYPALSGIIGAQNVLFAKWVRAPTRSPGQRRG